MTIAFNFTPRKISGVSRMAIAEFALHKNFEEAAIRRRWIALAKMSPRLNLHDGGAGRGHRDPVATAQARL